MPEGNKFVTDRTCGPCETGLIEDPQGRSDAQIGVDFLLGESEERYVNYKSGTQGLTALMNDLGCDLGLAITALQCAEQHKLGNCHNQFSHITRINNESD